MSKSAFDLLLKEARDLIDKPFKAATKYRKITILSAVRLDTTLRILAGRSYLDLVLAYQVSKSTLNKIFNSTCEALITRLRLELQLSDQYASVVSLLCGHLRCLTTGTNHN